MVVARRAIVGVVIAVLAVKQVAGRTNRTTITIMGVNYGAQRRFVRQC
jgi:hypothetical protein